MEFGQQRSHLWSGESRSYNDSAKRVTDETDPFRIEIVALQIAEDFRNESKNIFVKKKKKKKNFLYVNIFNIFSIVQIYDDLSVIASNVLNVPPC